MITGPPDPRITWIVNHILQRLGDPLSVPQLARMVNLSASRFRALFLAQTGLAPGQYIQRVRLRRARLLLERTFLSVKEVMALVGYNDPSHFARDFSHEHGAPPSEIRAAGDPRPGSPSLNPPRHRRISPPRARDPGWAYA
jgi:transcriptional regulator GlxA family with amidase domain